MAIGLGPLFGGLLVKVTDNVLAPFYVSTAVGFTQMICTWLFLPESLSRKRQLQGQEKHAADLKLISEDSSSPTLLVRFKRIFSFLKPVLIFMPRRMDEDSDAADQVHILRGQSINGRPRREWSLTLIAIAYAF